MSPWGALPRWTDARLASGPGGTVWGWIQMGFCVASLVAPCRSRVVVVGAFYSRVVDTVFRLRRAGVGGATSADVSAVLFDGAMTLCVAGHVTGEGRNDDLKSPRSEFRAHNNYTHSQRDTHSLSLSLFCLSLALSISLSLSLSLVFLLLSLSLSLFPTHTTYVHQRKGRERGNVRGGFACVVFLHENHLSRHPAHTSCPISVISLIYT